MSYKITPTDNFSREVKRLAKKHRSLKSDLQQLRFNLQDNPTIGTPLGKGVYKIRMAITSKGEGKSGGVRIITFVYLRNEQIFLLSIYDKSEKSNITDDEIKTYLNSITF